MRIKRLPQTDAGKRTFELKQELQQSGDDGEHVIFVGRPMVVTPGQLIFDPYLNGDDKMYWCALRLLSDEHLKRLPDQEEMAGRLNKSRQTIMTYQKMLRATRWLTVIHTVRQNNLPTRYSYSIHDEPMSVEEVIRIDENYIDFILTEATRTKGVVERLAQCCKLVLLRHYRLLNEQMNDQQKDLGMQIAGTGTLISLPAETGGETEKAPSPLSRNLNNGDSPSAVKNPDDNDAPLSRILNNGSPLAVKNSDKARVPLSRNLNNDKSSVVKDSDNDKNPLSRNLNNGENTDVKNPDIPRKKGSKTGDIYNRARVHPRAHARTRTPAQSRIKTYGFNNHPSIQGGGCGGRNDGNPSPRFGFLSEPPLSKLIPPLESKYGKKPVHSIITRLKALHYTHRETEFDYQVDADDAAIILTSLLLEDEIAMPLKYVDALIYRASQNDLAYRKGQYQQFLQLTGQAEPDPQKQQRQEAKAQQAVLDGIHLSDGTLLLGKSGTAYCIDGHLIRRCDGQPGGNTEDGLHAYRAQTTEDIKPLLLTGHLVITGKLEEQA